MGLRDAVKQGRGFARKNAKKVVSRFLGKVLGPGDDDPYGTYGGSDPDELTRVYREMSSKGGAVEVGSINRPKASDTSGARFDKYPVSVQPESGPWTVEKTLKDAMVQGNIDGKEVLFLTIVPNNDDGSSMEHDLAILYPHIDPQYVMVIARAKGESLEELTLGAGVTVCPPKLPLILAFDLPDSKTLNFKAPSVGAIPVEELRAALLDTLLRNSPRGPMAGGVSAQLMGVSILIE